MKILYLIQYFVPRSGSWSTRSYEFARRLIEKGHQVTVVSLPGYMPKQYQGYTRITRLEIEGVPVILIPVAYANEMRFSQRMIAFIRFALYATWVAMREKTDLIYASSGPLTIAVPGMIGSAWQRVPLVFEVRDLWPRLPIAIGALKNPLFKWLAQALEWMAYHRARHIVALSPGMKDGVIERGIAPEKVTVIPNSSDTDLFDIPPERGEPLRRELGLAAGQPLVVYAGTFGLMNNTAYLIEIARHMDAILPECRFLLIGFGAEKARITDLARMYGLLDRTVFIRDSVPKTEVPHVLAAATITISTFLPVQAMWDNSANKFFDSLAAGKPIAINYGGWQAAIIAETGVGVQIDDADAHQAAQTLADFLRTPEKLAHARTAAHALAYERFNRETLAAQQEALLRRLVEEPVTAATLPINQ
ncbi:MAG: glycosyltransferase family 4 protein [bacterium]|nr:glycosyltransferase family 4 protein [bacterium]